MHPLQVSEQCSSISMHLCNSHSESLTAGFSPHLFGAQEGAALSMERAQIGQCVECVFEGNKARVSLSLFRRTWRCFVSM